ncbi:MULTISPECIES: plasmid replication protein [Morganellaceae]|uniref:Replicase n=1 Tax=Proteus mirabilis TaxID=584 RepID=A0A1P8A7C4_PROMI|nr:plasmid replication protein [Proteus mirabilis]AMR60769.1 replicase [Proteus mirabilis]AMR60775.1 replicase [Proteus mirabilis]MDL4066301.1 plasmid replication protein [Proteus mirabilis]MDM3678898.1 plasmid replication protein [Proteus mirabilis]MDM3685945.1 plasmid replication protein [Proteus mirabilis]
MRTVKKIARERNMTAKEAAKKFGKSTRTIQRLVALDRSDYERRADERRKMAYNLRLQGKKWKEVGEALGCSDEAARALYKRYLALQEKKQKEAEEAKNETANYDLFMD